VTWNAHVTRRVIDACQDRNYEEIRDSVQGGVEGAEIGVVGSGV
jgi:hypothetical protein